jgi:hypothetical protein
VGNDTKVPFAQEQVKKICRQYFFANGKKLPSGDYARDWSFSFGSGFAI